MASNFGHIYGRPRIRIGYGKDIGKVRQNIQRKVKIKMQRVKKMGFGK